MKPLRRISGRAVPLDRENVDTDQIIPAHWLKRTQRTGYGAGLFEAWRADPAFVLNDPRHSGAVVLIAGANFGSGSSREHAAWALAEAGFRAIVSPRFADIFRGNAVRNGIVPVELPQAVVATLMREVAREPALEVVIDVEHLTLSARAAGIAAAPFALAPRARTRLLEGSDDIERAERSLSALAAYEERRAAWLPTVLPRAAVGRREG